MATIDTLRSYIGPVALMVICVSFLSGPAAAERAQIKPEFPRISGANIGSGGPDYDDPEYLKAIAKRDLTILGINPGWSKNGMTAADVVRKIKIHNPDILLGNYTNLVSAQANTTADSDKRQKLDAGEGPNSSNASDWWARDNSGNHTSTYPGTYATNFTDYTEPDANGDRYPEWLANRDYDIWFSKADFDIWFSDTVLWRPRVEADLSGGKASDEQMIAAYRRGHQAHWVEIRKLAPDIVIMPNVNWAESENVLKRRDIPEYDQQVGAAVLEAIIGKSWSVESFGGWNTMMTWYRRTKSYLKEPKIVSFGVHGDGTDYQLFRYGFASCLMDDGYFAFTDTSSGKGFASIAWFDEYDLAGTADTSWLGKAIAPPQTTPWKNGVYRRDFENGVALVNPKNNGRQTVSLEPGLRTIKGYQDPVRNNGQSVTSITLNDRDGVILVREGYDGNDEDASKPEPPVITSAN